MVYFTLFLSFSGLRKCCGFFWPLKMATSMFTALMSPRVETVPWFGNSICQTKMSPRILQVTFSSYFFYIYPKLYISSHSIPRSNLNRGEGLVTNISAASKYLRAPESSTIEIPPFQISLNKFFKNCFLWSMYILLYKAHI